jgi:hypothetical protein
MMRANRWNSAPNNACRLADAFPSAQHMRGALDLTAWWALVQLAILVVGVGYGTHRFREFQVVRQQPIPQTEPLKIAPRYDRPDVVTDEQLSQVLTVLQPRLRGPKPRINYVDHALRFWGVEASFADPQALSGVELRELLVDHRVFAEAWGPKTKPFLVPDTRGEDLLAFRTRSGQATASHVDHTLAGLAEVGTPLDFPLITPNGEMTLQAAFDQAFREFSLNQDEYEWSTLAFLHYLPHVKEWYSTEGQQITWNRLADRLMRQRLAQGVCFGQHRLHALALLVRVDEDRQLLSAEGRARIIAYLKDATERLARTQHADGYWDGRWPGDEREGPTTAARSPLGDQADRLLATGHILEWWAFAPPECLPPDETLVRAGQWLVDGLTGLTPPQIDQFYPFLTHGGRALSLWRSRWPHEVPLIEPADGPVSALDAVR